MFDPLGGGLITGGRMIWEGIKWIARSRQTPWSMVNVSATLAPHIAPWYSVRFFSLSEKPFAIEVLSARSIRPKGLLLSKADGAAQITMAANTEAVVLKDLRWSIPEKGLTKLPFERFLFVKLDSLKGEVTVDFELKARFLDNRRTETLIYARTNPVSLSIK